MSNQLAAFQSLPPRLQQLLLATERPFVRITASRPDAPLPPTASRFGGVGYLPLGTTIPSGPDGDLRLLAQINFAEVNRAVGRVPELPERGVLQIFIDPTDDVYGLDFDGPFPSTDGRYQVRFLPDDAAPIDQQLCARAAQYAANDEHEMPVHHELALRFAAASAGITTADATAPSDLVPHGDIHALLRNVAGEERFSQVWDAYQTATQPTGHKLLGYPYFTQYDPRDGQPGPRLLLQIDTDEQIMWGDVGVANFFIEPAELAAQRFDRLRYNWDCH